MKKTITFILFFAAITYQSCSPATFATVGNNGWKVTLYHYTTDVKIQENGQDCTLVEAYAGHKKAGYAIAGTGRAGSGGYNYFTDGIQLDRNVETHQITIIKGDKSTTVSVSRKSQPFIDVTAALSESKTMSF